MSDTRAKDLIVGAVVGGIMGAVAALLLAPKSGRELRSDLAVHVHHVSDRTQEVAGSVSQATQELARNVTSQANNLVQKAVEVGETVAYEVKTWRENRKEAAAESEGSAVNDVTSEAADWKTAQVK